MWQPLVRRLIGVALIAVGAGALIAATFLPWIEQRRVAVERPTAYLMVHDSNREYSGWDLEQTCGPWACHIGESNWPIYAGSATLLSGIGLAVAGGIFVLAIVVPWTALRRVLAVGGSLVVFGAAAMTALVWATASPHAHLNLTNSPNPHFGAVLWGLTIGIIGAAVAVVGTTVTIWPAKRHS